MSPPALSRRAVLGAAALTAAAPSADAAPNAAPPRFLWGAATAGHQVEGNNDASDIWLLEQVKPTLFREPSGDACDSLHRWREDLELARGLGLNAYRFSVEWARIEPAKGQVSLAYLDHYARIAEACREMGLAPVVTFSHFTSPRWFAAQGGWENPEAPALFARYAGEVARRLRGLAAYAVTFNEPNLPRLGEWSANPPTPEGRALMARMCAAAAKACGSDRFTPMTSGDPDVTVPLIVEGHRQARAAIKAEDARLPVGLSLAIPDDQAVAGGEARLEAKRRAVYGPFVAAARDDDFIGVQTYSRALIGPQGALPPPPGAERTESGDEYWPQAVGGALRWAHQATGRPVLITENGVSASDDAVRARFIPAAIRSVRAALADGVPVLGYIHWSLLDNFEWFAGYGPKFGLAAVDHATFARRLKPSAAVYSAIVRASGADGQARS